MNTKGQDHLTDCLIYIFYPDNIDSHQRHEISCNLADWANSHGGSVPKVLEEKLGSWFEIIAVSLPAAVATGIVGWATSKLLDSAFIRLPGMHRGEQAKDFGASDAGGALVELPGSVENEYGEFDDMGGLNEVFAGKPRYSFLQLGSDGVPGAMITVDKSTGNCIVTMGENEDLTRAAYDLTMRDS